MKKLFKFIQKYLCELMIIIGSGLFVYNVFNFSHEKPTLLPSILSSQSAVEYYYDSNTIILLVIGTILIVAGIIIRKNNFTNK